MSLKIFCAWRTRSTSILELVKIGEKVQEFHSWAHLASEFKEDVAFMAPVWPELYEVPRMLKEHDEDFRLCSRLAEKIVTAAVDMNASSPIWVASDSDKAFIRWKLENLLQTDSLYEGLKEVPKETWEKFQSLLVFGYERFAKNAAANLVFLEGEDGWTYIKGFGLSDAAKVYLDKTYENFEYTNQTEMGVSCFPKETQDKIRKTENKEEAYSILLAAQHERGALWDKALRGNSNFHYAGLHFPVSQDDRIVFRFFQQMLSDYLEAEIPPFKKEK